MKAGIPVSYTHLDVYKRQAAKEVLGTDDPDEVQKSVSDWDAFNATAEKMKACLLYTSTYEY